MRAALIGRGYWGKILIPYIKERFNLVSITGKNDSNIKKIAKKVDVFFVATTIDSHYEVVKKCLKQKKHVFCEKPLTNSYKKALKLAKIAKKNNLVLYTDYTEMVAPSRVEMLKRKDYVGKLMKINGLTTQYGKFTNQNVLWQLASHQLSMLSLFVSLSSLNFTLEKMSFRNNIMSSGIIYFNGIIEGFILVDINKKHKEKIFSIHGKNGKIIYDYTKKYSIEFYKKNNLQYKKKFNEKNNLFYSIEAFEKILKNKKKSNIDISLEIVKIIDNLVNS